MTKCMSPKVAIKTHCRACYSDSRIFVSCDFTECALHKRADVGLATSVKRIRLFCRQCVTHENLIRGCDGKTTNMGDCPLHPFRMAKNPNRTGFGYKKPISPSERIKRKECAKIYARAIKYKELIPGPCEVCSTMEDVAGHHNDYSKPHEVQWLCSKHHREHHSWPYRKPNETMTHGL